MIISIIAAIAKNRVIGKNNRLPWHLPADLKRFKQITMGKPVIMGQKTFESIGKPLPGRTNIVLTWDKNFNPKGCIISHSIQEALKVVNNLPPAENFNSSRGLDIPLTKEVIICGGASIYKQFLPLTHKMYLTLIEADFDGDAFFPEFNWQEWQEIERIENQPNKENPYKFTFITLKRKK